MNFIFFVFYLSLLSNSYHLSVGFIQYSSVTGTRTNNLLDAVPTNNAYADATAINIGFALQSGVVVKKSGSHWYRADTSQAVNKFLQNRNYVDIVAIGNIQRGTDCHSVFQSWERVAGEDLHMKLPYGAQQSKYQLVVISGIIL